MPFARLVKGDAISLCVHEFTKVQTVFSWLYAP